MELMGTLKDGLMYLVIAAVLSWFFYNLLRRNVLGGFFGGVITAAAGSILGMFLLNLPVNFILDQLQQGICFGGGERRFCLSNVNIIAAGIGGFLALYILHRISHSK